MKIKVDDLMLYEAPRIAEFVSFSWGQQIVANYLAWKINRKMRRYNQRMHIRKLIDEVIAHNKTL